MHEADIIDTRRGPFVGNLPTKRNHRVDPHSSMVQFNGNTLAHSNFFHCSCPSVNYPGYIGRGILHIYLRQICVWNQMVCQHTNNENLHVLPAA